MREDVSSWIFFHFVWNKLKTNICASNWKGKHWVFRQGIDTIPVNWKRYSCAQNPLRINYYLFLTILICYLYKCNHNNLATKAKESSLKFEHHPQGSINKMPWNHWKDHKLLYRFYGVIVHTLTLSELFNYLYKIMYKMTQNKFYKSDPDLWHDRISMLSFSRKDLVRCAFVYICVFRL